MDHGELSISAPDSHISANNMVLQCVIVAGLSLVANLFVRAHHLSVETQEVVLGVDRAMEGERNQQALRSVSGENTGSHSVELQEGVASQVRLRS